MNDVLITNIDVFENASISTDMNCENSVIFGTDIYTHSNDGFSARHVLLDTCAGESVFSNKRLFYEIMKAPTPMIITGVNPKGEPLIATHWGSTDFGMVYYNKHCIANILSFGNVVNSSESVLYDNEHDCYIVQVKNNEYCYTFSRDSGTNIYLCDLDTMVNVPKSIMVVTVNDKKKKYTARQVKQAELAREYQRKLGYASPGQLIKMIGQGQLVKSNISAQDVVRALDIWGPDLGSLKGKTTSHKAQLEEELPLIKQQFEDQTMYLDLMFVNGLPFLIAVVNPLEYVMVNKLSKRDNYTLWGSLESNIHHITKYGFKIKMVRVDGEGAISTTWFESKISSLGIILDTTGAGEAVAVVERKIRQVKERVRAIINTLPYTLTEKLEGWLVRFAVNRIVLVPTRNSIAYSSPREKLYGRKINVDKELKHGFGDYVQVHTDSVDNSNRPRTQGAIALMSSGNLEGSWYYMLLSNEQIVKRTKATILPISDEVITHLNTLSAKRKISKTNNIKQPIFEQNNRTLIDEEDDEFYDDSNINRPAMIEPNILLNDDEHVAYEIEREFDEPDENMDENPEFYQNNDDVDEILDEINNDYDNDFAEYDDIAVNNQALLDDIFGVDSDVDDTDENENYGEIIPDEHNVDHIDEAPVLRRSARNHQPGRWNKRTVGTILPKHTLTNNTRTYSFNMTVSEGIKKLGDIAIESITIEMQQMLDKNVWEGVMFNLLTAEQRKTVIPCKMFLKEKIAADGSFDKLKSRIVAGGHMQDRDIYDNGSSPTVSTTSVFIIAAIAAKESRALATIDFPGAFLNSDMPLEGDHVVFMRLNKYLSDVLTKLDKSYEKFINTNGTIVVKLHKALYGCVESAKLWYDKISNNLRNLNYVMNKYDICVFNRIELNNTQTTLVIHVDDMMITSCDDKHVDKVINEIEFLYPGLTKIRGKRFNYIGMTFDFQTPLKVTITMDNFIHDLLEECKDFLGVSTTPAKASLFKVLDVDELNPLLPTEMRERFHSLVAKLLYASKRARWDLLTPVAFLTKRVINPQRDDLEKLKRTIQYIRGTQSLGVTLEVNDPITVTSYIDASYGVHHDLKSHTGCTITLGKGTIYAKSSTQKLNTKSSTEAELVAMSDGANQVIWTRNFLLEQDYQMGPAIIYQDNMSTIQLIKNGKSNSERTRYINIRYFFLTDRIKSGDVIVTYMKTEDMIADILTKPIQGEPFRRLRNQLLNSN